VAGAPTWPTIDVQMQATVAIDMSACAGDFLERLNVVQDAAGEPPSAVLMPSSPARVGSNRPGRPAAPVLGWQGQPARFCGARLGRLPTRPGVSSVPIVEAHVRHLCVTSPRRLVALAGL